MCANGESFKEIARDVVRSYIRSALLIDDEFPEFNDALGSNTEEVISIFQTLRDVFTESKILFSGLRFKDELKETAKALVRKADLLILDWDLAGDDGASILELLESLMDTGFTFACIYTGKKDPAETRRRIIERLGPASKIVGNDEDFIVKNIAFCIYNKPGFKTDHGRELKPEELLDEAIKAFSSTYSGYTQLALMELTVLHRETLPRMLEGIDPDLDMAVMMEAAIENSPIQKDGRLFRQVLADDWRAELERAAATGEMRILSESGLLSFIESCCGKISADWLEHAKSSLKAVLPESRRERIDAKIEDLGKENWQAKLRNWLEEGLSMQHLPSPPKNPWHEKKELPWVPMCLIYALIASDADGADLDPYLPLLKLDRYFHQSSDLPSRITQGTIVKPADKDQYLICITAACDAEWPSKIENTFVFLKGEPVSFTKSDCPYVVIKPSDSDAPFVLGISLKKPTLMIVEDTSIGVDSIITGNPLQSEITDDNGSGSMSMVVIAQLRREPALGLAHEYATLRSRVGLDQVETIRLVLNG